MTITTSTDIGAIATTMTPGTSIMVHAGPTITTLGTTALIGDMVTMTPGTTVPLGLTITMPPGTTDITIMADITPDGLCMEVITTMESGLQEIQLQVAATLSQAVQAHAVALLA